MLLDDLNDDFVVDLFDDLDVIEDKFLNKFTVNNFGVNKIKENIRG